VSKFEENQIVATSFEPEAICIAHFGKHCLVVHLLVQKPNQTVAVAKSYVQFKLRQW